jgi:hypothetical protein
MIMTLTFPIRSLIKLIAYQPFKISSTSSWKFSHSVTSPFTPPSSPSLAFSRSPSLHFPVLTRHRLSPNSLAPPPRSFFQSSPTIPIALYSGSLFPSEDEEEEEEAEGREREATVVLKKETEGFPRVLIGVGGVVLVDNAWTKGPGPSERGEAEEGR